MTAAPRDGLTPQEATYRDAGRRLAELRNVRAVLLPDADDPEILSELTELSSQIRHAELELGTNVLGTNVHGTHATGADE